MTRSYVIWPLRFSHDPAAMIDFYTKLGLHKALDHDSGTYASFDGLGGSLGVHDAGTTTAGAVPNHTGLNLATADIVAAADELRGLGLEVRVWDETYGKQAVVIGRDGRAIGLNESSQEDLYGGYHVHPAEGVPSLDVVAVHPTPDMVGDAAWFGSFGFTAPSYDDPWWIGLRASDRSGVIGIHHGEVENSAARPADDEFGPAFDVRIGFETHLPLAEEAAKLRAAGLTVELLADEPAPRIVLTDPDGEEVQIHPAP